MAKIGLAINAWKCSKCSGEFIQAATCTRNFYTLQHVQSQLVHTSTCICINTIWPIDQLFDTRTTLPLSLICISLLF